MFSFFQVHHLNDPKIFDEISDDHHFVMTTPRQEYPYIRIIRFRRLCWLIILPIDPPKCHLSHIRLSMTKSSNTPHFTLRLK